MSCEKEEQSSKSGLLMPMNTGNTWTYKQTHIRNDVLTLDTSIIKVGEKITIDGYTCYAMESVNSFNAKYLIGNDEYGNFVHFGAFSDVDTLITPLIVYKMNAKIGDEWESPITIMFASTGDFRIIKIPSKCISEDTLILTPKGKFHCKAFERYNVTFNVIYRDYVSVNIGRIKSEIFEDDKLFSIEELLEYHLNK